MRFFRSLFGAFFSLSTVGERPKNPGFSRVGVSGCPASGNSLSWLVAEVGFEVGAKLEVPMARGSLGSEKEIIWAVMPGAVSSVVEGGPNTSPLLGEDEPEFFCNLEDGRAGDRFEGRVLLLCTPVVGVGYAGLAGLGAPFDCLECREDTDTFRRTPPCFLTSSAPALAFEMDLRTLFFGLGVPGGGVPPF